MLNQTLKNQRNLYNTSSLFQMIIVSDKIILQVIN